MTGAVRHSTEAELDALLRVGERLGGFDPAFSAEWIDGALAALMAGPSVPAGPAAVVERLFGDTWARTFADPDDVAQALAVLDARWRVLRSQLDPEALWEAPDVLRLAPMLLAVDDDRAGEPGGVTDAQAGTAVPAPGAERLEGAARAEPASGTDVDAGTPPEVEVEGAVSGPRLGEDWAAGFLAVAEGPEWGWQSAGGESADELLAPVRALAMAPAELAAYVAATYEGGTPSREQLVDDACAAAQDLRLWWVENAPRTAPRQAERTPGRNDPCPCGSGKKYKKCHGAA